MGTGGEVDPNIVVAIELLGETGVALNSIRLAFSALSSAEYSEGMAEKNHGGRDVSPRATHRRLVASPATGASETADVTYTVISLRTMGEHMQYVCIRRWAKIWRKCAGRVDVMVILSHKILASEVDIFEPGKLNIVVRLIGPLTEDLLASTRLVERAL